MTNAPPTDTPFRYSLENPPYIFLADLSPVEIENQLNFEESWSKTRSQHMKSLVQQPNMQAAEIPGKFPLTAGELAILILRRE